MFCGSRWISKMPTSWFTQLSPSLNRIHRQILQYRGDQNNQGQREYKWDVVMINRSLYQLIRENTIEWVTREGLESGLMQQILDILATYSTKEKRVIVCDVVSVLLSQRHSLSRNITSLLYPFFHFRLVTRSFIQANLDSDKRLAKKLRKIVSAHTQFNAFSIQVVLTLYSFSDSFAKNVLRLLESVVTETQCETIHRVQSAPCSCSHCVNKKREMAMDSRNCPDFDTLDRVWKSVIRHFSLDASNPVLSKTKSLLLQLALDSTFPPFSPFACRLLLDLYQILGINAFIDDAESLWNSTNPRCCALMTCLVSHSTLLDTNSALTVLNEMCLTSEWTESMQSLLLHALYLRLSAPHTPLSPRTLARLQSIALILSTHLQNNTTTSNNSNSNSNNSNNNNNNSSNNSSNSNSTTTTTTTTNNNNNNNSHSHTHFPALIHAVGWLLIREIPSLPLCCRQWRLHLCPHCSRGKTTCWLCETELVDWGNGETDGGCAWKPPDSVHRCRCGSQHPFERHACLCENGDFPVSFDYSISSSSEDEEADDDDADLMFEIKRIHLENEENRKRRAILGFDVWCSVLEFVSGRDLVEAACASRFLADAMKTNGVWRERYLRLFKHYRCGHGEKYVHCYYHLTERRVKSLLKRKKNEVICQVCGCVRRFTSVEEYEKHLQEKHS